MAKSSLDAHRVGVCRESIGDRIAAIDLGGASTGGATRPPRYLSCDARQVSVRGHTDQSGKRTHALVRFVPTTRSG